MEKYSIFRETGKQIGSARLTGRAEIVQMLNQGKSIAAIVGSMLLAICKEYGIARNTFDRFRRQYTYTIIKGEKKRWRVNGNAAELKEKIHATL